MMVSFWEAWKRLRLLEKHSELGIWLKSSAQGKGYGYEALKCLVDYLNSTDKYEYYLYGVDQRNESSVHLVEKFRFEKCGYEEVTTQSGKALSLVNIPYY